MQFIGFDDLHRIAGVPDLIGPIAEMFRSLPVVPERLHYSVGEEGDGATLLVMPAWRAGRAIGTKLVTVFPQNAAQGAATVQGVYLLFSGSDGAPLAAIDGKALTLIRTAAVSAVAADLIAPKDVDTLLLVGTGALIPYLFAGHCHVRRYRRVLLWGRDRGKAHSLAQSLSSAIRSVEAVSDLEAAARTSDVISCATLAHDPLLDGAWLSPGTHLDLVGGFTPQMREANDACVIRAQIVTDSMAALHEAGDLVVPLTAKLLSAQDITLLGQPLSTPVAGKDITMFKSVGTGASDLIAAEWIFRKYAAYPTA